jgi:hypothetical protein
MATDEDNSDRNPLEAFLSGNPINRDELGTPPLANTRNPLLDRERIHISNGRRDRQSSYVRVIVCEMPTRSRELVIQSFPDSGKDYVSGGISSDRQM